MGDAFFYRCLAAALLSVGLQFLGAFLWCRDRYLYRAVGALCIISGGFGYGCAGSWWAFGDPLTFWRFGWL